MSFKTSSLHQRDTRSFSSSKQDTSPYNSRSYQSKQPYDQAIEQSNGIFETETDLREYQTAPKSNAAKNMRDLYNSNAVSEYVPSEYGTNENIKRKPDTEVKSLLSSFTNSIKGYSQLMKENKEKIAKYSASEKKNHIPKGRDSGNKKENGHSNNHNRAKSFSGQDSNEKTPGKKITPSTSAKKLPNSKYFREELQLDFHHEEAYGEEKFMSYTKDLESDLDQVSLRLASSIRKDFEKTAHNILHQHINKASLIEKDDTYRNREANYSTPRIKTEIGFTEESPYRANLSIEKRHIIPEKYEADRKPTPEKQKNQPFTLGQIENNTNWAKSDKKTTPIVPALNNEDVKKEFRSETKNYKSLEANKANKYPITSEKKVIAKEQITPKQGYSPKRPAPVLEAKIGFSKNQSKQTFSPAIQSPSQGNLYENSAQLSISPGKNMTSASLRQEGIYAKLASLDDLHPEQKILKLQEISIQLMKEHHFDDALEYLLEADMLVRNELPANNPQQIYVYYLLGECYVKKLDYYRAEKVLGIAVNKYEENDREFGKDGKNACYYLALMVLQSHVYMSTKQFRHAFEVYKKLVKGVESYCLAFERENLKGIIPHILLIKYNMGECLSSLERREEADIVFHEVATKFNIQDQEQLENFGVLLNIGEHFMKRQQNSLALETLQRICDAANSKNDFEKGDFELISLMNDEVANILFNKKEYLNSAKYYEASFKIKVKVMGMKHLKVGYLLLALGKAYYMASEHHKALHRFSSGLDVIESIEGRNTVYSANISLTMAKIHYALKDYKKSIHFYERSVDIYSQIMGSGHPYCLRTYANLIFVCFESGHAQKALDLARKLINMIKEMNNSEVFTMLNEIGNIYRKNECFEEALSFYETALEKLAHANQKEISSEAVNLVYTNVGSAHFHLNNYDEALQYYKEAAKYFGRVDNGVNVHAVSIYINIIRLYKVLGKSNEAGAYLKKATGVLTLLEGEATNNQLEESIHKLKHDLTALKKK